MSVRKNRQVFEKMDVLKYFKEVENKGVFGRCWMDKKFLMLLIVLLSSFAAGKSFNIYNQSNATQSYFIINKRMSFFWDRSL